MRDSIKKILLLLTLAGGILMGCLWWLTSRPVEIIDIHQEENFSEVLVRNFPITDTGKIKWWLKNSDSLKIKYDIPKPSSYGNFYINFWDFGDGYKEQEKYDRLCFYEMKAVKNCIEKKAVFSVENGRKNDILFTVYDGIYRMQKNGKIVKLQDE